ncbi:unnamed protein product [Urochloa decumbens]|uniref:Leucine-rich repeat-containing N-terminal plant-type domain-containing protein n=1 Tax=Urochloa decumbens TaxID=240449 RepID=A0ABC8YZ20_9POAL
MPQGTGHCWLLDLHGRPCPRRRRRTQLTAARSIRRRHTRPIVTSDLVVLSNPLMAMINILLPSITILFLLFLPIQSNPVRSTRNRNSSSNTHHCVPHEWDALLAFRASLSDPGNYLSSWQGEGCCQWKGICCSNHTGHVVELRIWSLEDVNSSIRFRGGQMSTPLLDLKNLRTLNLRDNNFGGAPIPEFIGGLKSLRYLYISNSKFGGRVPPQIGNLPRLLYLDLNSIYDDSYIYSTDLAWLSRLTTLKYLDLSKVNLSTVTNWVHVVNKLPSLVTLNLRFCGLQNVIPSPVNVNLTSLEYLDLYEVGNMTLITRLYLNVNNLTGTIPTTFKNLRNLEELLLYGNNINGPVAVLLERLPTENSLQDLTLFENNLSRNLPNQLRHLRNLTSPDLNKNELSGEVPTGISILSKLKELRLGSNNLHGTITENHFAEMASLSFLELFGNSLSMVFQHGWRPPFKLDIAVLHKMEAETMDFSKNCLASSLPKLPENLRSLDHSRNNLSGLLPSELGKTIVDLSENQLHGTFPNCEERNSSRNKNNSSNMVMLNLNANNLSGEFLVFLCKCQKLVFLDLGYNQFSDMLPTWIGDTLPSLSFLSLRSNLFSGHIPLQLAKTKGLQYLDLACNNMSGAIPQPLADLIGMAVAPQDDDSLSDIVDYGYNIVGATDVVAYTGSSLVIMKGQQLEFTSGIMYMVNFDLSCNSLTGHIPKEIGKLPALKNLNLSWNHLSGVIPDSIGEVQSLESLDLSHNEFGGEIPASIAVLTSLEYLNLSYNNLTGRIPSGNQLQTLNGQASIYVGNPGLCGPPLSKNCSEPGLTPPTPKGGKDTGDAIFLFLAMSSGYVMGLWTIFCLFLFNKNWRVACFKFSDCLDDWVYVHVSLSWAFCTRRKQ